MRRVYTRGAFRRLFYDPRRVRSIHLPRWLIRSHLLFFGTTCHTVLRRVSVRPLAFLSFVAFHSPKARSSQEPVLQAGPVLAPWRLTACLLYELNCLFSPYLRSPFLSVHSVGTYAAPVMGHCSFSSLVSVCLFSCMTFRNS